MTRRVLKAALIAVTIAGFALAIMLLILPRLLGYKPYVITGGSMTGSIARGSLIYADPVPVDVLRVGDVITFAPPGMDAPVTHRIVSIRRGAEGLRIRTRGDNVGMRDPWTLVPQTAELPRYVLAIPWVGFAIAALSLPLVRILLFVVPAALIALAVLVKLWRQAGRPDDGPAPAATSGHSLPGAGAAGE